MSFTSLGTDDNDDGKGVSSDSVMSRVVTSYAATINSIAQSIRPFAHAH